MRHDAPPETLCSWKIRVRELTVAMAGTWQVRGKSVAVEIEWTLPGNFTAIARMLPGHFSG